jgi:hypothetical protein
MTLTPTGLAFTLPLLAAALSAGAEEWPDIRSVPLDLTVPPLAEGTPAAGKRVRAVAAEYAGTAVYHTLYLPLDWEPGRRYPVIVEYAGNGPYQNAYGDTCTGKVEDCGLGYGSSGGKGFIWVCLPTISADRQHHQLQWWGDVEATVAYCLTVVPEVCRQYGGDPQAVLLAGFSRGAIACNYIGLHDDAIAALWCGFICHSHYDGVLAWPYPGSDRAAAARRLQRLGGRPQFISHEVSSRATREYLAAACPQGRFTFVDLRYRNHTDSWVRRDTAERQRLREWVRNTLPGHSGQGGPDPE